jgi:chromosome segregation ATPase
MADLETAADAALAKVKQLEEQADRTEEALTKLEGGISAATTALEADWTAVSGDLSSVLQQVQEQRDQLADRADQAAGEVEAAAAALAAAPPEADEALRGAWEDVKALAEEADAARPRLQQSAAEIEAAAARLREAAQGVQSQLETALDEAGELLGTEMVAGFKELQAQVRARATDLARALAEECQAALREKYDNWLVTLNDVEELVADAFQRAHEHVGQVVEYSLQECAARHQAAVAELADLVGTLEGAAQELQAAVAQQEAEVGQARGSVAQGAGEAEAGLEAMTEALLGVRELMARFTFVKV